MLLFMYLSVTLILATAVVAQDDSYYKEMTPEEIKAYDSWKESSNQNLWELCGRTEGDMVLVDGQENGVLNEERLWPNATIPYTLSSNFTKEQYEIIFNGMNELTCQTCIKMRPQQSGDKGWISIMPMVLEKGCKVCVGYLADKAQSLHLHPKSHLKQVFLHLLVHAVGLYHQHNTPTRDYYLNIKWDNIKAGKDKEFTKHKNSTVFGQYYDYRSIMHFSPYAFSKDPNTKPTIETTDPDMQNVIGKTKHLSPIDILNINNLYNCPEVNAATRKQCDY